VRRTASEKMEIIRLVEEADLPIRATLRQLGVPRSTFYGWYQRYEAAGFDGLEDKQPTGGARWNAAEPAACPTVRLACLGSMSGGASPFRLSAVAEPNPQLPVIPRVGHHPLAYQRACLVLRHPLQRASGPYCWVAGLPDVC
jgi:transposase-like protein